MKRFFLIICFLLSVLLLCFDLNYVTAQGEPEPCKNLYGFIDFYTVAPQVSVYFLVVR